MFFEVKQSGIKHFKIKYFEYFECFECFEYFEYFEVISFDFVLKKFHFFPKHHLKGFKKINICNNFKKDFLIQETTIL